MNVTNKNIFPSWVDILLILAVFLLMSFFTNFTSSLVAQFTDSKTGLTLFISYLVQFVVTIGFALWLKRFRGEKQKVYNFRLSGANPRVILWGVILTVAVSTLIEPLISLFSEDYFEVMNKIVSRGGWILLTTVVAAPILEEVLFRGIIQSAIEHRQGKWSSLLLTSFIFGIVHINPPQAINAFCISLVLGYLFIRTRSLLCVVIIHAFNNAIAYFMMMINDDKYISLRDLINNETIYKGVYLVSVVVFLIAVINVVRIFRSQNKIIPSE